MTIFVLFRPIGVSLKTALTAKIWTIALTLDIKISKKFLNLLIKLSRICSHPTIYGSRYLCVRYGKLKNLPYSFLPRSTYIIKWFARAVPKLGTIKRTTMCIDNIALFPDLSLCKANNVLLLRGVHIHVCNPEKYSLLHIDKCIAVIYKINRTIIGLGIFMT